MIEVQHFIFYKDHSQPCYTITSRFDKGKGMHVVELLDPKSMYVPVEKLVVKKSDKKTFINMHDKLYEHYFKVRNKQDKEKEIIETHATGFLTLFDENNQGMANCKIYSCDVSIIRNFKYGECEMKLDMNLEEFFEKIPNKKNVNVYVWFGNDPSYKFAGKLSSLGYYLYGFELQNAEVTCANPVTFSCKPEDAVTRLNRPTRIPTW